MEQEALYHVMLEGRRIGPYDRRTIVGMRIKKTLANEHILVARDGRTQTVGDLLVQHPNKADFSPNHTGNFSVVQATYAASVVSVEGRGLRIPRFRGEVEARVQGDVLRVAGRFRRWSGWREDRVKLPLKDVLHARVRGSQADLWMRAGAGAPMQRVTLEMFSPDAADDLVERLPLATPWSADQGPVAASDVRLRDFAMVWAPAASLAAVILLGLGMLMYLRA